MRRFLIFLGSFGLLWATAVQAQQSGRAGLVIVGEDGVVQSSCVAFPEESISGFDLLSRSGLAVTVDVSGAGTAVCAIEGTGCPADDCFCACQGGGECTYWSYWLASAEGWQYARAGASQMLVAPGDVQGWTWGAGSLASAVPPPPLVFTDICDESETPVSNLTNDTSPPLTVVNRNLKTFIGVGIVIILILLISGQIWRRRR